MNLRSHIPNELPETGYKGPERRAINQLIRALRRLEPVNTPTTRVKIGPQGTAIEVIGTADGTNTSNLPRWL